MSVKEVKDEILKLKTRILEAEKTSNKLSETDTRQGLINPLFRVLGQDFSDFNAVKSELRHKSYNEPVDYAFFSSTESEVPILLMEAKALGIDLNNSKIIKQICTYMGEMGVQWGVLSDGNKYIMYNSRGGDSFQDQRFLTLQIKDVDTEDGLSADDLAEKLVALMSRECLENDEIQKTYEEHMINGQIKDALYSLFSEPFDTLALAIRKEFKEERVNANSNLRITTKRIIEFLTDISDEEGKLPLDLEAGEASSDEDVLSSVASASEIQSKNENGAILIKKTKRITIHDLLEEKLVHEGDNRKLEYKGEISWARVTGNGELEVNGQVFSNPSRAGTSVTGKPCAGWGAWLYKSSDGAWDKVEHLRGRYRDMYGLSKIQKNKSISRNAAAQMFLAMSDAGFEAQINADSKGGACKLLLTCGSLWRPDTKHHYQNLLYPSLLQ